MLATHLVPRCTATDLFGKRGRVWLAAQPLPLDERIGVEQRLRELDRLGEDLAIIDRGLGQAVLEDRQLRRLLTITGVNATVAIGILAAIGDISRFTTPQKLVSYFGLNPRVHQSGLQPAQHGHISRIGRAHARGMLVEAAWAAAKAPGPLRSFFLRIRARRGMQIAAVATARKLATITWYVLTDQEDYTWARPSLVAAKERSLQLQAGAPAKRGRRGIAADYSVKALRDRERVVVERAERAYSRLVGRWKPQGPKSKSRSTATS